MDSFFMYYPASIQHAHWIKINAMCLPHFEYGSQLPLNPGCGSVSMEKAYLLFLCQTIKIFRKEII